MYTSIHHQLSQDSHSSRTRSFGVVPGLGPYASQTTVQRMLVLSMTTERSLGRKREEDIPSIFRCGGRYVLGRVCSPAPIVLGAIPFFLVQLPGGTRGSMPHLQSLWKMGVDPECQKSTPTKTTRTHPTHSTL
jgi:hypothetical protein